MGVLELRSTTASARIRALTLARPTEPTSMACRWLRQHEFRRRWCASLRSGYALPARRPPTATHVNNRQSIHLSETKRCSDEAGHLSRRGECRGCEAHLLPTLLLRCADRISSWATPAAITRWDTVLARYAFGRHGIRFRHVQSLRWFPSRRCCRPSLWRHQPTPQPAPSWNVAPTQSAMVVRRHPETPARATSPAPPYRRCATPPPRHEPGRRLAALGPFAEAPRQGPRGSHPGIHGQPLRYRPKIAILTHEQPAQTDNAAYVGECPWLHLQLHSNVARLIDRASFFAHATARSLDTHSNHCRGHTRYRRKQPQPETTKTMAKATCPNAGCNQSSTLDESGVGQNVCHATMGIVGRSGRDRL